MDMDWMTSWVGIELETKEGRKTSEKEWIHGGKHNIIIMEGGCKIERMEEGTDTDIMDYHSGWMDG